MPRNLVDHFGARRRIGGLAWLMLALSCSSSVGPRPLPTVPRNQGGFLSGMTLAVVFPQGSDPTDVSELTRFAVALPSTQWWSTVSAEYGINSPAKVTPVTGPAIASPMSFSQLTDYVDQAVTAGTLPSPDQKTLYLVIMPRGEQLIQAPGATGEHGAFKSTSNAIAFAQNYQASGQPAQIAELEVAASHEIFEVASDSPPGAGYVIPVPQINPWTHSVWSSYPTGTELGDLCGSSGPWVEGDFSFARIWSNQAAAQGGDPCLPAVGTSYFNTSASQDWYPIEANGQISIPVGAWSTLGTTSWTVTVQNPSGLATFADGDVEIVQNGAQFNLLFTAPWYVTSGDHVVVLLNSQDALGGPVNTWPVGIYVP